MHARDLTLGRHAVMGTRFEEIEKLYVAERARLERQVFRKTGCAATARDLVHDVFLRFLEKTTQWTGNPAAFLNKCASNAAIDHLRLQQHSSAFVDNITQEQYAATPEQPQNIVAMREEIVAVQQILLALPEKTRHIFLLNRVHNRSFTEIAAAVGISERAVAKHMARAVAACEEAMHKCD